MKTKLFFATAIMVGFTMGASAQTINITEVLDTSVDAAFGSSVYSATFDPTSNKYLAGTADQIGIFNGDTGVKEGSLSVTGITYSGLGFFALAAADDGRIFAYEHGDADNNDLHADIWRWDDINDTTPTKVADSPGLMRVGHVLGTGASTRLFMTGTTDNGAAWIWDTTDDVTYTQSSEVPDTAIDAKSALAVNATGDTVWAVGDVGSTSAITKAVLDGGTWTADTGGIWIDPAIGGGPMIYDDANELLFILPMPGQTTLHVLDPVSGYEITTHEFDTQTNFTTGYNGSNLVSTEGSGTLWMAARGAVPTDLAMYKITYEIVVPLAAENWALYN
jgi:hypothetical protein